MSIWENLCNFRSYLCITGYMRYLISKLYRLTIPLDVMSKYTCIITLAELCLRKSKILFYKNTTDKIYIFLNRMYRASRHLHLSNLRDKNF